MNISLTHPCIQKINGDTFEDIIAPSLTLSAFCGKIQKYAKKIEDIDENLANPYYQPTYAEKSTKRPLSGKDVANKFKGDIFELFTEFFLKLTPIDDRIGVFDYQVVTENDTGVDGWGYNKFGEVITVQVKYRIWDYELDHINGHFGNFRRTSFSRYGIDPKASGRMLIVTTGKQINWRTLNEQFLGNVRCISNNASYGCIEGAKNRTINNIFSLQSLVNDSSMFWKLFNNEVKGMIR